MRGMEWMGKKVAQDTYAVESDGLKGWLMGCDDDQIDGSRQQRFQDLVRPGGFVVGDAGAYEADDLLESVQGGGLGGGGFGGL